jgi:type IV fimbrial biogenesis protein FimT
MFRVRGYSLLDLLITLTVGSILLTGATGATRLVRETSQTTEINTFVGQLNLARTVAISRGQEVILCPSGDGLRCSRFDDYAWWEKGTTMFVDANNNRELDNDESVLQRHLPRETELRIKSSRHRARIVYQPSGFASGTNLTFTFCVKGAAANQPPRYVVVSNTGRARVSSMPADGRADQAEETCS